MKQLLLTITFLLTIFSQQIFAQDAAPIDFTLISTDLGNNRYQFNLELPSLDDVESPTPPHYSYYISYGDGFVDFGHFEGSSNTLSLEHTYDSIPVNEVTCRVYNNYGHGTPPPDEMVTPNNINVSSTATAVGFKHNPMIGGNDDGVKIQPTFYPRRYDVDGPFSIQPEDDIALVLSYKNQLLDVTTGELVLLFDKNQFAINDVQTYHYEPSIDKNNIQGLDRNVDVENTGIIAWQINQLPRGQERQIILDLNVLPERLTREATFKLMFIPQNGGSNMAVNMDNQIAMSVLTERDPNKMTGKINKKLFQKEDYDYTIQFFNEGDGPVTDIRLEVKEMYSNWKNNDFVITRMNIGGNDVAKADLANKYELEFKDNVVIVQLKNVRLEGLNADDLEKVAHAYATIDFTIEPKKDWKSTKAQTSIFFGKQDAVMTKPVRIFPQNRFFLGVETGYAYDFIDTDPLARDEGIFFRGVTGWRFTDRTSLVAEFGLLPSFTETEGDISTTKQSSFINPQLVFRLNTWWKASAGISMLRQETENYFNNTLITNPTDDSFRFLVDTHVTPVQNRFFNLNIGARYYQPFNNSFTSSVQAYAALRINILE